MPGAGGQAARMTARGSAGSSSPRSPSRDPPLLNVVGVHQPWALRAIVEVHTDSGLLGLGETYADETHLARLEAVAAALPGHDPYDLHGLRRLVATCSVARRAAPAPASAGCSTSTSAVDTVYSPFEVACLDLMGREVGRPVSDLLGGAVRDRVPFSGYLFYKWAGHPGTARRRVGRGARPRRDRGPGEADGRRLGLRLAQAQGRGVRRPTRSARPSRRCARRSPTCRCAWTPTARGRPRHRSPSPSD